MTTPAPARAARIASALGLFFVLAGITTATLGAAITWGLGPALICLGACLLIVGLFIATVG